MHHLMTVPPDNASSFTVLLELPAPQAVELLHDHSPEVNVKADRRHLTSNHFNSGANLTFPIDATVFERAARFSFFAGDHKKNNCNGDCNIDKTDQISSNNINEGNIKHSPETTGSAPSNSSGNLGKVKNEPAESKSNNNQNTSQLLDVKTETQSQKSTKSKEGEKKGKAAKKSKTGANHSSEDAGKLPYIHVRARRGQSTDSHSLAERARREKINARMKFLQELVPGCSKISGTALVLDEIINHVQSLQHQVEFLSMRLAAAVNPRNDINLDSILAAEGYALNVA